jgi:hypothetical protein
MRYSRSASDKFYCFCFGLTGTPTLNMPEHHVTGGGISDWLLNCNGITAQHQMFYLEFEAGIVID